jgi:hypothetical protein
MSDKELKQFRDGVAMGRSFGVPPAMLFGYWVGYWLDITETMWTCGNDHANG